MNNVNNPSFEPAAYPPMTATGGPFHREPSNWPSVLGVIAIIFGVLAILGGLWGMVSPLFVRVFKDLMPREAAAPFDQIQSWGAWMVLNGAVMTTLAGLLLTVGIGLMRRKAWSIPWARVWAVAKMVFVVSQIALQYQIQREQFETMFQADPGSTGPPPGFMQLLLAVGFFIGLLWGWALPVFTLVWLGRRKIREDVTSWT
jgi:hypothetical protein